MLDLCARLAVELFARAPLGTAVPDVVHGRIKNIGLEDVLAALVIRRTSANGPARTRRIELSEPISRNPSGTPSMRWTRAVRAVPC